MSRTWTHHHFDELSWHDCAVHGMGFRTDCPEEGAWLHDLVLDIDFITEWICGADRICSFKVAPARLQFHDVTALKIDLDWGGQYGLVTGPFDIDDITRALIGKESGCCQPPEYAWRITTAGLVGGEITFGATGFTQTLLCEPIEIGRQDIPYHQRQELLRHTSG